MLAATLLFLIGLCISVHFVRTVIDGSPAYAYGAFAAFAIFAAASIIIEGWKRKRFIQWLIANRKQVQGFGENYEGHQICNRTELREFHLAFSVVAFSFRIPSRFFIQPSGISAVGIVYSIASALCGWWGIPFGPVYTVQSLYWNFRGGRHLQVWQIFHDIDNNELQRKKKSPFIPEKLDGNQKLGIGIFALLLIIFIYLLFTTLTTG